METKKIKDIKQKIIISIILAIMIFNFIVPTYSKANVGDIGDSVGGTLFEPIVDFLAILGDGLNWIVNYVAAGEAQDIMLTGKDAYAEIARVNGYKIDESTKKVLFAANGTPQVNENVTKVVDELPTTFLSTIDGKEHKADIKISGVIIPKIRVTPAEIFSGKVAILDANFFNDMSESEYNQSMIGNTSNSAAWNLRKTISSWYQAFRLVALVGLLSVLVYIGIRIVTSAVATDKAKYKEMFVDWVIALCLVFFMHYIMVFTLTMVGEMQKIIIGDYKNTDMLYTMNIALIGSDSSTKPQDSADNDQTDTSNYIPYTIDANGEQTLTQDWNSGNFWDKCKMIFKSTSAGASIGGVLFGAAGTFVGGMANFFIDFFSQGKNGAIPAVYPVNLIGYTRIMVNSPSFVMKLAFLVMYLALTFYTIYFFFIYVKRVVILTFLTIIAPLVALTYPIDKVKDSKAQAFQYWLREYVVNALTPLIHLILYQTLVSSAINLVATAPFYAICVLAFIVPAEKMVKSMFGIRSETAPPLGGFAGGALVSQALQRIGKGKGKPKDGKPDKIRTKETKPVTDSSVVAGSGISALSQGTRRNNPNPPAGSGGMPTQKITRGRQIRLNAGQAVRRKFNLPRGQTIKTLAKRAAMKTGRVALRGSTLAGGALLGLAGGIVGGDLSDMWKGASLGAIAGNKLGDNLADGMENFVNSTQYELNEIKYGEKEAANLRADAEFMNDTENRGHLAEKILEENPKMKYSDVNKEVSRRMEQYSKYRRTGVTNIKEMDRLYTMQQSLGPTAAERATLNKTQIEQKEDLARRQTLEISKLSTLYNAETFRDASKTEKAIDSLAQRFMAQGISDPDQAKAAAIDAMTRVRKIKGE